MIVDRPSVSALLASSDDPLLPALVAVMRHGLAADGWVVARALPFADWVAAERDRALLSIAEQIGKIRPHADQAASTIWPVAPRAGATTISERDGECEAHTDSCYIEHPERYVALYCVRPAADGGESLLVGAREVLQQIAQRDGGRDSLRILGRACVPFAVPKVFRLDPETPGAVLAPVWSRPGVRWRCEQIAEGFRLRPDLWSASLWDAVMRFRVALDETAPVQIGLAAGDLLVIDNRRMLHARKHFTDSGRLLLRIRLDAEDPP